MFICPHVELILKQHLIVFEAATSNIGTASQSKGSEFGSKLAVLFSLLLRANAIVIALFENFGIAQFLRIIPWSLRFFHCWSKRKTDVAKADTSSSL